MQLRLVTYNIRKAVGLDWRRRPERVIEVLAEIEADIVALQEADKRLGGRPGVLSPDHSLGAAGLQFVEVPGARGSSGFHGNAILIGQRLSAANVTAVDLPSFEPRGALAVEVAAEDRKLLVVGAHLGLLRRNRLRQIDRLGDVIAARAGIASTVVMGDFNEWRKSAAGRSAFHPALTEIEPAPTFHTSFPRLALDRVHVSPDIDLVSARVHDSAAARRASDHLPLVVDIEMGEA